MAQLSFSDFEKNLQTKKSRKAEFLEILDRIVPWSSLIALISPYYPKEPTGSGRRPYPLESMLRIYLMQLCYSLSDPMMENELIDSMSMRKFAHLGGLDNPTPDETTILNFRHLLERHSLCGEVFDLFNQHLIAAGLRISRGTIIDATIIEAPCSIKNSKKERDPEAKHTKKGNQYHFGIKAHVGVDAFLYFMRLCIRFWDAKLEYRKSMVMDGTSEPSLGVKLWKKDMTKNIVILLKACPLCQELQL